LSQVSRPKLFMPGKPGALIPEGIGGQGDWRTPRANPAGHSRDASLRKERSAQHGNQWLKKVCFIWVEGRPERRLGMRTGIKTRYRW
jgi:hypothetical protein